MAKGTEGTEREQPDQASRPSSRDRPVSGEDLESGAEGARAAVKEKSVGFGDAFRFWIKLGFINFGGPAGQISIMHRELVEQKRWVSENQFLRALNFCMLLPGPEAQQLATYIGWRLHGIRGGLVAGSFFIIPSIFVLLLLSYLAVAYSDVPAVTGLLYGVGPVVVAVVLEAVLRIGRRTLPRRPRGLCSNLLRSHLLPIRAFPPRSVRG